MRKQMLLWTVLGLILSVVFAAAVVAQEATPEAQSTDRPVLGITVSDEDGAVTVQSVASGSGAEAAGLEVGDVITGINGDEVTSGSALAETVSGLAIGDTVTLTIERDGEEQEIEVTLGAASEIQWEATLEPRFFMRRADDLGLSYDSESETWTITELSEDSPLYEAGLRVDDVITAVDGESLEPMALFQYLIRRDDATVTLTVERDGETQDIEVDASDLAALGMTVMLETMPRGMMPGGRGGRDQRGELPTIPNMPMFPGSMLMAGNGRLGVTFIVLDEQVAAEHDVEQTEGALIVSVSEGSPAAEAGLLENDVITAVNGEPVDAERTLRDRLIAYEPGDTVTLDVIRDGETQQIEVTLGQPEMSEFIPFSRGRSFRFDPDDMDGIFRFFIPDNVRPQRDGNDNSGNTSTRPNV